MRGIAAVIILIGWIRPGLAHATCTVPNFSLQGVAPNQSCTVDTNYLSTDFGPGAFSFGAFSGSAMACEDSTSKFTNRVALAGDGTYLWTPFSSNMAPNTINVFLSGSYDDGSGTPNSSPYYFTANLPPSAPIYGFPAKARCYCVGTQTQQGRRRYSPLSLPPAALPNPAFYSSTFTANSQQVSRVYPVTFDVINTQTQDASIIYGPVPITSTHTSAETDAPYSDARLYTLFNGSAATSFCGCPNFNEDVNNLVIDPNNPNVINPCQPLISAPTASTPGRVLATFVPSIHKSLVLNPTSEPMDPGSPSAVPATTPKFVDTIMLPATGGDQANTVEYKRKIWTCASPYEMVADSQSGIYSCKFVAAHHRCSDEDDKNFPSSPVADEVLPSSTSPAEKFKVVVNKKLACCMNGFRSNPTSVDTYEKFDCIDNSKSPHNSSFDDLWSSSDDSGDGGRVNALMLRGSGGKLQTGFYSLKGERCNQFSEFAATDLLMHYKVDPAVLSGQQNSVGSSPTAIPSSGSPLPGADSDFSNTRSQVLARLGQPNPDRQNSAYPLTANDMRACPILVRAAMIATCPPSLDLPAALSTAITSGVSARPGGNSQGIGNSPTPVTRCATAGSIQIHIKIEQIFEITGQVVQKTIDTVINANQSSTLDISKIILSKNGDQCPPGTSLRGGMCTY